MTTPTRLMTIDIANSAANKLPPGSGVIKVNDIPLKFRSRRKLRNGKTRLYLDHLKNPKVEM